MGAALYLRIRLLLRRLRQVPGQQELTLPEISALSRLDRGGPTTPGELAKAERMSPEGLGGTLNALAQRGFVERRPIPGVGRRVVMSETEAGQHMLRSRDMARTAHPARPLSAGSTPAGLTTLRTAASLIERLGERI